ncbi:MAG TPA: hypothetical protein VMG08_18145 [Allosphingosinicella sp.]|nr:hypothetical protein [Allosphingosinicella sp.]
MTEKTGNDLGGNERLILALRRILGASMGVRLIPGRPDRDFNPLAVAAVWLVIYLGLWLAVDHLAPASTPESPQVKSLLAWGALYFAAGIYLSVTTTAKIFETVRKDILPYASPAYIEKVTQDLEKSYSRLLLLGLPLFVGLLSLLAALFTLGVDIKVDLGLRGEVYSVEIVFWCISYFIYFFTAAEGVVAARFYGAFARHLEVERGAFYVLGAAETPLVRGLSKLCTQVLIFWIFIFIAVISIMLLAVVPPDSYRLTANSSLLFTLVPIAGFFSLGFGALVYVTNEANIRATLQRFTYEQALALQTASNQLLYPTKERIPEDQATLDRLAALHDRILAGGRYGNRVGISVSIALPLLMPIASLIVDLLT